METLDKYLVIVNSDNHYESRMVRDFEMKKIIDSDGVTFIEKRTFEALKQLEKVMLEKHNIALSLTSAGRTVKRQQQVLDDFLKSDGEKAYDFVALPGTSEHHTGLALDVKPQFAHSKPVQAIVGKLPIPARFAYPKQPTKEEKKEMYAKLHSELTELGFIVRYPEGKNDITKIKIAEPWHIRYVGKEHAKAIAESGLCLEEYVLKLQNEKNSAPQLGEE